MQIKDTDIYKLELFYIQQGIYRQLWKYALSTYPKKRRGRGSSSVSSSLSAAILLGRNRGRKKSKYWEFPFTEEGRTGMIEWLNQKLSEFK